MERLASPATARGLAAGGLKKESAKVFALDKTLEV